MAAGAALLAPLVALFSPIERRAIAPFRPPGWRPSTPVAALAALASIAALTLVALHGLPGLPG
jgi:hypothetical protein